MRATGRWLSVLAVLLLPLPLLAQEIVLRGHVTDPQGNGLPQASVQLGGGNNVIARATAGPDGGFELKVAAAGQYAVKVGAPGFRQVTHPITVRASGNPELQISLTQLASHIENLTVTADVNEVDVLSPDPAEKVFVRQDLLDANPGRPGAPVSIPGYPIETASSGIKAPQYFAPGVAGDHGEPIAQYIAVGSYLLPNNLSANAHGNGYSDPNLFIPEILESVQVDGGAFNVREGNHSVNLAAIYGLRSRLDPFITVTGDYRDLDVVTGFSPSPVSFVALAASYGNGFLDRLEHRQQYKFNGQRLFHLGDHRFTLLGIGYYGSSYVPGLTPIYPLNTGDANFPNLEDTIDPRQKDQTHTGLVALNDVWQMTSSQQLQLSGFFRTYNLALDSDFGLGLIRQSEFRTVAGGSTNYVNKVAEALSLLVGLDYNREAPRRDNLDHYLGSCPPTQPAPLIGCGLFDPGNPAFYGPFGGVTRNNVTIGSLTPYIAAEGALTPFFRYYLGWRRDEINFANDDLLRPENSLQEWAGVNSPKATITFVPRESWWVPRLSLSFGESFFTNDPRIQSPTPFGPVSKARSYQLVASKTVHKTDLKLTLGHVMTSATLAKLDNDTGLQENEGPGRIRFMTVAVRRNFKYGSLLATFSKADARDLDTGDPTPEAPRTIFDFLAAIHKLPLRLEARGEFEYVGAKPLGAGCIPIDQCVGVPVKEFRGAVIRPFLDGRVTAGVNFLIAVGYTGQTLENFYPSDQSEVVGVRIPSYASITLTYKFGHPVLP